MDARSARFRPHGATVFLGADVEVEGTVTNGIVIATKVQIEKEGERGHGKNVNDENETTRMTTSTRTSVGSMRDKVGRLAYLER